MDQQTKNPAIMNKLELAEFLFCLKRTKHEKLMKSGNWCNYLCRYYKAIWSALHHHEEIDHEAYHKLTIDGRRVTSCISVYRSEDTMSIMFRYETDGPVNAALYADSILARKQFDEWLSQDYVRFISRDDACKVFMTLIRNALISYSEYILEKDMIDDTIIPYTDRNGIRKWTRRTSIPSAMTKQQLIEFCDCLEENLANHLEWKKPEDRRKMSMFYRCVHYALHEWMYESAIGGCDILPPGLIGEHWFKTDPSIVDYRISADKKTVTFIHMPFYNDIAYCGRQDRYMLDRWLLSKGNGCVIPSSKILESGIFNDLCFRMLMLGREILSHNILKD